MWEKKGKKVRPNLDEERTKMLNLRVLQRTDPFVEEILMTTAHVTFYEFNVHLSQWGRKDVEGSFFVVKGNTQPRFQFIVMNRRNTDNLVENLLGDFEYEVQVPYLLYRNAAQEVNGIWFYSPRECEEIAILFSRILGAYSKVPTKSQVSLSKSEFEKLEAVPCMAVMDGPLEPSPASSAPSVADSPVGSSFMNFFSGVLFYIYVLLNVGFFLDTRYSSNYGPVITREKVRDALTMLTQDNQFIDIIYRALLHEHQP